MRELSPSEIIEFKKTDKVQIIDIREEFEYNLGCIESLWIPMNEIVNRIEELAKDKLVIIVCRTGKRAAATANLINSDFPNLDVAIMKGGIVAWKNEIDPELIIED